MIHAPTFHSGEFAAGIRVVTGPDYRAAACVKRRSQQGIQLTLLFCKPW
jgi:hypothetical protein